MQNARDAVANAVAAEPNLAEVQTAPGNFNFWLGWDWSAAEAAFRRGIALDPNYPLAHRMLGVVRSHSCRHDEAQPSMQRARELDPLYAMHQSLSSHIAFAARDYPAAAHFARQALVVDPEFWTDQLHLAQVAGRSRAGNMPMQARFIGLVCAHRKRREGKPGQTSSTSRGSASRR